MNDYTLRTRTGAPIYTTDDRRKAMAEAIRLRAEFPGCYVEESYPPPPPRRIWTDRLEREGNVVTLRRRA